MKRVLSGLLLMLVSAAVWAAVHVSLVIAGQGGSTPQFWPGGIGTFTAVSSSWNSGTVTLEFLGPDGATYIAAGSNTTCTANCAGVFYLPAGQIEAVITGSPTAVFAAADQVQTP